METLTIALGIIVMMAIAVLLLKYLQGDFTYTDHIMFYDKIKAEYIVRREWHNGKVEIIKKDMLK